jgi:hypothetical protein
MRAADIELFPTSKGQFRAELTEISFDRLWLQRGTENLAGFDARRPCRASAG